MQGLIDEAEEAEVDSVHLSPQESQILAALVKSLGNSYEPKVGNISLRNIDEVMAGYHNIYY